MLTEVCRMTDIVADIYIKKNPVWMCSLPSHTIHADVLTRQVLSAVYLIFSLSCATLIFTLLMLVF